MSKAGKRLISAIKEIIDALRNDTWDVSRTERGNVILTPVPAPAKLKAGARMPATIDSELDPRNPNRRALILVGGTDCKVALPDQ